MPRPNIFLSSEFSPSQQILSVVALWASAQLPRSSPEPPANKVSQTTRSSSDERAFSPASGSNSQPQVIPHTPGDRPSPPPDCHSHPVAVTSPFPTSRPLPLHPHEVAGGRGQLSDKDFQAPPSGLLRTCRSENGSLIKIPGRCMRVTCTISRYTQRKGREAGSSVCLSVCLFGMRCRNGWHSPVCPLWPWSALSPSEAPLTGKTCNSICKTQVHVGPLRL